ncbi:MAG: 6-carboxytetrahydropterin synthase QueD [Candidatus Omnitrophica bacterium]|nr:6-carboxytetrahydropterin synthase QueD [Candidatus Omnitrophota bacterium]
MFTIKVKSEFNSAHNLRGYKGKCEELHGHNWTVELAVCSEKLDKTGMVVDFKEVKEALNEILQALDHKYLNELKYFKKNNPTSENIAKYIFNEISERRPDISIKEVTVWETDSSAATYSNN